MGSAGVLFFPQRRALGFDSREVTPGLRGAVVQLAAEVRSFGRASVVVSRVVGEELSESTIRRLVEETGEELRELQEREDRWDGTEAVSPQLAVVKCDGGRLRTREPGSGRGVKLSGEKGWRETKNATFEKMVQSGEGADGEDPCAEVPSTFRSVRKAAELSGKAVPEDLEEREAEASEAEASEAGERSGDQEQSKKVRYHGPRRLLRTVISSMSNWREFGWLMYLEAKRRGFHEALVRCFLGDGLVWNWLIWKEYFRSYIPILDFIHLIEHLYVAALVLGVKGAEVARLYLWAVSLCWAGRVDEVIEGLRAACRDRGVDPDGELAEDHPLKPAVSTIRYLQNNRDRMDYPRYRREGLPVTSASMESVIKQINLRVKGTEMFWTHPAGAEAILQVRAAALCEDGRLDRYLAHRPGHPFLRRSSRVTTAA